MVSERIVISKSHKTSQYVDGTGALCRQFQSFHLAEHVERVKMWVRELYFYLGSFYLYNKTFFWNTEGAKNLPSF